MLALNPLVGLIEGFRWSLLGGPAPGPEALVSLGSGLVLLISGAVYFRRAERSFADVIWMGRARDRSRRPGQVLPAERGRGPTYMTLRQTLSASRAGRRRAPRHTRGLWALRDVT